MQERHLDEEVERVWESVPDRGGDVPPPLLGFRVGEAERALVLLRRPCDRSASVGGRVVPARAETSRDDICHWMNDGGMK